VRSNSNRAYQDKAITSCSPDRTTPAAGRQRTVMKLEKNPPPLLLLLPSK
jgi:hypothetical protein